MTLPIEIQNLHYTYPSGVEALRDIGLSIGEGERWGFVGATGSGKSTLLHHVAGIHPSEHHVVIGGRPATRQNLGWIRSQVGFVFQNPEHQLFMPTLREDVAFGPLHLGLPRDEVIRRVDDALTRMHLKGMADRPTHHLSGGERRAAALATILAIQPRILVLDEPTNDLDPAGRREIIEFARSWDGTLLVASHDLELILEIATHVAVLEAGAIAATGEPRAILTDAELMERNRLEVPLSLRVR